MSAPLNASYFDGRQSKRHPVTLMVADGRLHIAGQEIALDIPADGLDISAAMGDAPRTITLPEGGLLEVMPGPALELLLADLEKNPGLIARLQSHWAVALLSLLLLAALVLTAYQSFIPWAARTAAPHFPETLIEELSADTLTLLDQKMLRPSQLDSKRQAALQAAFARLAATEPRVKKARLDFRSSPTQGPNALALPNGQLIVLDELVALSDSDEEVLAVLAHELGHVRHRHGIRLMIQSSLASATAAVWLGDTSTLAALLGSLVLSSSYSRQMELEADDYSLERFRRLGLRPDALLAMLVKLEASGQSKASSAAVKTNIFSTHPETAERIERLQASVLPGK